MPRPVRVQLAANQDEPGSGEGRLERTADHRRQFVAAQSAQGEVAAKAARIGRVPEVSGQVHHLRREIVEPCGGDHDHPAAQGLDVRSELYTCRVGAQVCEGLDDLLLVAVTQKTQGEMELSRRHPPQPAVARARQIDEGGYHVGRRVDGDEQPAQNIAS